MRILIIGGTRFIGPFVVRELVAGGHEVAVFHRGQSHANLPSGIRSILGDRRRLVDYREDFRSFAPQVVLDMIPFIEQDARTFVDVFSSEVERLVAVSSMDVYRAYGRLIGTEPGPPDSLPLTEESPMREKLYPYRTDPPRAVDDPQQWMDDYDKIPIERIVLGQAGLPGTVLRLPAVYGPGDRQHRLYPYVKRMDDHRPAILLGEKTAGWRWTRGYVEDVAFGIALAAVSDRAAGQIYNIGEPHARSEAEWVRAIAQSSALPACPEAGWIGKVIILPEDRLPAHLKFNADTRQSIIADTGKIRRELGYRERVDPQEALRRTIAWERANPPERINPQEFDYAAEDDVISG